MGGAVTNGASLAGQMTNFPALFPAHIIALTAAGEQGGFLEFAFEESALWAEQETALRQGLWIPRLLIWQSIWSVLLFQPLFPSLDMNNIGVSVKNYLTALLVFICLPLGLLMHGIALVFGWLRQQPFGAAVLRQPFATPARRRSFLENAGVGRLYPCPAPPADVGNLARTRLYRSRERRPECRSARTTVARGRCSSRRVRDLDAAVQATGLMDNDPLNLLITGQMTGQWQEMLEQVTGYYQEEAARAMEKIKSAQRQAGVVLTLVSGGYVMIAATYGLATLGFRVTEGWDK